MLSVLPLVELLPLGLVHFRSRFMQSVIILKLIFVYFLFYFLMCRQGNLCFLAYQLKWLCICEVQSCSDGK